MGGWFGTTQNNSGTQNSTQQGTSQSNLVGTPGFNAAQSTFFNQFPQVGNISTGPNAYQTAAADSLVGGLQTPQQIAATGLTPGTIQAFYDPYQQQVIDTTAAQQQLATRQGASDLRGGMGTRGSLGNDTGAMAAYRSARDTANQQQLAQLRSQGYGQAVQSALASQQQRLGASSVGQQGGAALGQVGEMIRQAGLQGQTLPFDMLAKLSTGLTPWVQASGQNFSGTSTGATTGNTQTSPGMGNILAGLAGTALSAYSDPELKDNMRQVGTTFDGQPLYAFNYKPGLGLPQQTQVGLDATEVAERDPGAVGRAPLGLAVDYDRALAPSTTNARDGGEIAMVDKVAHAFNAIQGLRRAHKADGGEAGFFSRLFPQTTSLGTQPGGWDTSVTRPGIVDWAAFGRGLSSVAGGQQPSMAAPPGGAPLTTTQRAGQGLSEFSRSVGGMGGSPGGQGDAGQHALGQQQAALASALQGLVSQRRDDGGRVGYADGGDTLLEMPAGKPGTTEPSALMEADVLMHPAAPGHPGLTPPQDPATTASPAAWAPVVERASPAPAAPAEPTTFWGRLASTLAPDLYHGRGIYHNQAPTPAQNLGIALMAASGPMVFGHSADALLRSREINIRNREAERASAALEHQMRHQAAVLAETSRHHGAMEEHPAVRAVEAVMPGMRGTPEFRAQVMRILDRDRAESAFDVATAQASAKDVEERNRAIEASRGKVAQLDQLESLLAAPGVPSGALANWELGARRLAASVFPTANIEGLGAAEAAQAITSQLVMEARNPAGGAGLPGAASDADRKFLETIPPGITRTPGGNQLLLALWRGREQYNTAIHQAATAYIAQRRNNTGLPEYIAGWVREHPIATTIPAYGAALQSLRGTIASTPALQTEQAALAHPPPATTVPREPPAAAVAELRAARGTPDEARRIQQFNAAFAGGRPGLAERLMSEAAAIQSPLGSQDAGFPWTE